MFNEKHALDDNNNLNLAFLNSQFIQVYPCSRRRGATSSQESTLFDPEARLNTEANARKHIGLNGFTVSYIKEFSNTKLSLVLDGYLFDINLQKDFQDINTFGTELTNFLAEDKAASASYNTIYANIRLEEIPLYSGDNITYNTWILRNQSKSTMPELQLDLVANKLNTASYYFSGLSFTFTPLSTETLAQNTTIENRVVNQKVVSLCILEKSSEIWKICQSALLPKINHGETDNSVQIPGALTATSIMVQADSASKAYTMPVLTIEKDSSDNSYQLCFTSSKNNNLIV